MKVTDEYKKKKSSITGVLQQSFERLQVQNDVLLASVPIHSHCDGLNCSCRCRTWLMFAYTLA